MIRQRQREDWEAEKRSRNAELKEAVEGGRRTPGEETLKLARKRDIKKTDLEPVEWEAVSASEFSVSSWIDVDR